MLNIDTRILSQVTANQYWLLNHLLKFANSDMTCYPSNQTLCKDTGWTLNTLQKIKSELIEKRLLIITERRNGSKRTSNEYCINTDLISVFVPAKKVRVVLENDADTPPKEWVHTQNLGTQEMGIPPTQNLGSTPYPKNGQGSINQKEVLADEVLEIPVADSTESAAPSTSAKSGKKARGQKVIKEKGAREPLYQPFIDAWDNHYRGLLTMPRDGAKIKSLIKQTREYIQAQGGDPNDDNTLGFWTVFVAKLKATWYDGKNLAVIDSHYKSIITEIKNGGKKRAGQSRGEEFSAFAGVTNEDEFWAAFDRESTRTY